jgi:hypothetical protein
MEDVMDRVRMSLIATAVCAALAIPAYADDERDTGARRRPWSGHAQLASRIVVPGDPLHPTRCDGPAAILGGAGLTNLLGQFLGQQSHCLNQDGSFDKGHFVFTATDGRTIRGQYYGRIVPAVPPPPDQPPTSGLILGSVCVQGGTAFDHIVNDCAAHRYAPARGVLNLTTGDGTIFLDYALGVRR